LRHGCTVQVLALSFGKLQHRTAPHSTAQHKVIQIGLAAWAGLVAPVAIFLVSGRRGEQDVDMDMDVEDARNACYTLHVNGISHETGWVCRICCRRSVLWDVIRMMDGRWWREGDRNATWLGGFEQRIQDPQRQLGRDKLRRVLFLGGLPPPLDLTLSPIPSSSHLLQPPANSHHKSVHTIQYTHHPQPLSLASPVATTIARSTLRAEPHR
jgi:hypothetical protein